MKEKLNFYQWYSVAEIYYNYYGNSKIKKVLKRKICYEYAEDGKCFVYCFANQRKEYRYIKLNNMPSYDWALHGNSYLINIISYRKLFYKVVFEKLIDEYCNVIYKKRLLTDSLLHRILLDN